ncbi:MAG: MerR family transcriptional regulator [Lachnospiraceae bacterium]|nr:MerR family transcriptional regulator [Lachnospiraceae bacterium]
MDKTHYIISDAAKELHVEAHVLRYWEEELELRIPRNKLGHRIYGEKEMALFRQILMWKKEGLSLKEIQTQCQKASPALLNPPVTGQVIPYPKEHNTVTEEDSRMVQFKQILGRIVTDAIHNNSEELTAGIASNVSTHVNKELDYLFREKEEADEKRFRQLDETIRSTQRARQEAAAAQTEENKAKNRHFFGKK